MTGALASLGFIMAAWLSFAAATALATSLLWPIWKRRSRSAHPGRRAGVAFAAAVAPALVPTLLVAVCLAPGLAALLGWHGDHCLSHAEHPHLCLAHITGALHAPELALLVLGGGALAIALLRGASGFARTRRFIAGLRATATRWPDAKVGTVPSEKPFSFATGIVRREVWVSSALADALSPDELEVVLLHERAHLERRDPWRRAAAAALSRPLWPSVRRAILNELVLASEQACDERAAEGVGDRLRVADTILAVERLAAAGTHPASVHGLPAFGGSAVARRVRALVEDSLPSRPPQPASWAVLVLLVATIGLAAEPLHHLTEHWLRILLGSG